MWDLARAHRPILRTMKKILSALALSAAFAAAPAPAQVSHVYIGAGVGTANTDSSEFSWKILGGYQHDRHWESKRRTPISATTGVRAPTRCPSLSPARCPWTGVGR